MKIRDGDWHAWYNVMPPGPPTFHVLGSIDVGNNSDGATLVLDSLEKKMPPTVVLRIVPRTIFVPRPDGKNVVKLHFTMGAAPGAYGAVKVVLDDEQVAEIDEIEFAH